MDVNPLQFSSETEWQDWLSKELQRRKTVFGGDPDELIASYTRERNHASSYEGRELLELVQNADDAGTNYNQPNRMLIELTPLGLFVANTGVPFSSAGVKSLMVSDNSPKRFQRNRCIGYKGLGFRSVLGWASSIFIVSANLSITFSDEWAQKWLDELTAENTAVKQKIIEVSNEGFQNPIATLSVPCWYNLQNKSIENEATRLKISELRALGFDTIICLTFNKNNQHAVYVKVKKEMEKLGPEVMLFLQHLQRLELVTPRKKVEWEVKREKDVVIINPQTVSQMAWKIFSDTGLIDEKLLKPNEKSLMYEVKLAVGFLNNKEKSVVSRCLFDYFPTKVLFPYPLIVHATFDLTENRQNILENDVNRFIAQKLAKIITSCAEKSITSDDPWRAFLLTSPQGNIDPVLQSLEFEEFLKKEISKSHLIPVRRNKFEKPKKCKIIQGNFDDLLEGNNFKDICLFTDNTVILSRLEEIGVDTIELDALRERLNRLSENAEFGVENRAELIFRLVNNHVFGYGVPLPELLLDEYKQPIPNGIRALLPPEGKHFSLPDWMPSRIIDSELVRLLKNKFALTVSRELLSKLWQFNIQEYNLNSVVSSIVAESNRRVVKNPENELKLRQEMLQAIWPIYLAHESEDKPTLTEKVNIILPNREGKFQSADSLYFGVEYPGGKLLESFYLGFEGTFVATHSVLGLIGDIHQLENFLGWLGVSDMPRIIQRDVKDKEFLEYVLENINYPANFEHAVINSKDQATDCYPDLKYVMSIDRLDKAVQTGDPHAIIAWIIKFQETLEQWRVYGDSQAKLTLIPPSKYNRRTLQNQSLSSFVLWTLKSKKWLPSVNGEKQSPSMCILAKGLTKEIYSLIGYPALNLDHPLFKKMKIERTLINNALSIAGAVTDLDELSWDSFYKILIELPKKDPDGEIARTVYRTLIAKGTEGEAPDGVEYRSFINEGRMFGRHMDQSQYFKISELYYFENQTLPFSVSKLYNSLDLDKRKGANKVRKLFGVRPFSINHAKMEVVSFQAMPCSNDFQSELDELKPFIYALRVEEDSDLRECRLLKELKFNLCEAVKFRIAISEGKRAIDMQPGESIIVGSEGYLVPGKIDPETRILSDELVADSLGEVITALFKVDIGANIARLATCSPDKRPALIDKILGGSGEVRIKKAAAVLNLALSIEDYTPVIPIVPPTTPKTSQSNSSQNNVPQNLSSSKLEPEITPNNRPDNVGSLHVEEGQQISPSQATQIRFRVRPNPNPNSFSQFGRPVLNSNRAENLAIAFELSQGRQPILVSHIQGYETYKCDILSFSSKEDAESFKNKPKRDLVCRYIEVKGSVNEKGNITLRGNELTCAQDNRGKYFLYRVFEGENEGVFELVETQDPLHVEDCAIKRNYEINPFRTAHSKCWNLKTVNNTKGSA